MIPVLYSTNAADFSTCGLGVLTDTVSCEVTEERNGVFECLLRYPVSGQHYGLITKECSIKAKPNDNAADTLEGTSVVSNNDIREMVTFNLLRNSRADDGLAYWTSSGFTADGENGASGTASFMAEDVSGMTKSLSQTVYPANRDSYTISAQIGSKDLENAPVCFNGIVRSKETVILLNLGGTSAGLDIRLYPKQDMEGGSVMLAQGVGGQKAVFPNAMYTGVDVSLHASTRECMRNGAKETKTRFLSVQRGVGFQAYRVPPAGEIRAAFIPNK